MTVNYNSRACACASIKVRGGFNEHHISKFNISKFNLPLGAGQSSHFRKNCCANCCGLRSASKNTRKHPKRLGYAIFSGCQQGRVGDGGFGNNDRRCGDRD